MLRPILLVVGIAALVGAFAAVAVGAPFGLVFWLAMVGAALVGGLLFERGRYKPATRERPGQGWVATDERFIDPQTGDEVTVYYQPASGERRYVTSE
jgi:hypothetical protein